MSVTSPEQSALAQLAAARRRGEEPDALLDLADAAIEQASRDGDSDILELIAAELDSAAETRPDRRDGLRVAAARARAAAPPSPPPSPPAAMAPETTEPARAQFTSFASWGSRFLAWVVDWVILTVAASLVAYMVGRSGTIILIVGAFAYFAYLNGRGSTIGKRLVGIKVVDATTREAIGAGRGVARELARLALTIFTLGIGLVIEGLRPLWNGNHQTAHDAAANSIVINERVTLVPPPAGHERGS